MISTVNNLKKIFFILTVIYGLFLLYPFTYYPNPISHGDHGRDLYQIKKTLEGKIPYKDYESTNGPLMPYYYSSINQLFGLSLNSTIIGYNILVLFTGILIYLTYALILSPVFAFTASLWYWSFRQQEFFYTFNHIGGLFFLILTIYFIFLFLKEQKKSYIVYASLSIFLLSLIRPSIAVACGIAGSLTLLSSRHKHNSLSLASCAAPAFTLIISYAVYFFLTKDPAYSQHISDIYIQRTHLKDLMSFPSRLINILLLYYNSSWKGRIFFVITGLLCINLTVLFRKKFFSKDQQKNYLLYLTSLLLFFLGAMGEFMFEDLWFRFYWCLIPFYMLNIAVIELGLKNLSKKFQLIISLTLFVIIVIGGFNYKNKYYEAKNAHIVLLDRSQETLLPQKQKQWLKTVKETQLFLEENLRADEPVFCFPYCPLYNYLTGKDTIDSRLDYFGINGKTEESLILLLEEKKVRFIVLSNHAYFDADPRFGILNKTYGFKFEQYVKENFFLAAQFGPWESRVGWTDNHATQIYKRKDSF